MTCLLRAIPAQKVLLIVIISALFVGCGVARAAAERPPNELLQTENGVPPTNGDEFELEAEFTRTTTAPPIDPLSGYNRAMTHFNDRFYFWVLKPVAQGYRAVLPEGARLAVGRFFNNLMMPMHVTNNLLQFKPKQASIELARFAVNITVGVLGFGDPAANTFDLRPYPEDFGQTLGFYGFGGGFHLVLPLLGPSNLRDTLGRVPDYYLDPLSYIDRIEVEWAVTAYEQVNKTSLHLGEYESLKKDAIDLYSFLRDSYESHRIKLIKE